MKNSLTCPKCGSKEIGVSGTYMKAMVDVWLYVCCDCGYSELWSGSVDQVTATKMKNILQRQIEMAQEQAELDAYWKQKLAEQKTETKRKEYAGDLKKDPWEL